MSTDKPRILECSFGHVYDTNEWQYLAPGDPCPGKLQEVAPNDGRGRCGRRLRTAGDQRNAGERAEVAWTEEQARLNERRPVRGLGAWLARLLGGR